MKNDERNQANLSSIGFLGAYKEKSLFIYDCWFYQSEGLANGLLNSLYSDYVDSPFMGTCR